MSNAILQTAQDLNPGAIISLFRLDTRSAGGGILSFVQTSEVGEEVQFDGIPYTPMDVIFEGIETTGIGALPTPIITISNTDGIAQTAVNTFGDLLGCPVTRVRTFARHLDGHFDADPLAFFGPDRFVVERKASEGPDSIQWELSANIDQEGKQLPGRHVIRDTCMARYRQFAGYSAGINGTITQDVDLNAGVILNDGSVVITSGRPVIRGYINPANGALIDVRKHPVSNGKITLDDGTVLPVGDHPLINEFVTFNDGTFINVDVHPILNKFIVLDNGTIVNVDDHPIVHRFDYSRTQCPYTGDAYFDELNNPVNDAAKDKPSRTMACCKSRFGNQPLPFWGFPGIGRRA